MNILVINAGSSSLKYQLIRMEDETTLCKGICERIGIDGKYSYKTMNGYKVEKEADLFTHKDAFDVILHEMVQGEGHVIDSVNEIAAIGHRVTHGGDKFSHSVLVDEATIDAIANMRDISPLHNPPQAATIRACRTVFGEALPMAAVFDTAFHATMPPKAYTFAIPYKYYEEHGVRRYGFHGTSHRYVSGRMAELLGEMPHRLITCHLGNGSSLAAIKDGKVVDTSMGFTPLDGIIMGTRCGSIDPSIVSYIANLENLHERGMNRLLNNESGLLGVSGVSSDFRDVLEAAENGNERAQLAADMLEYQLVKLIGSYAAALGGVDAILFTGGIGENAMGLREQVMDDGTGVCYRVPEFDLEVSAQDENPYKTMEYNQLALQLFQMGFFREDMADQALRCLELMDFKNKDQLTAAILQGKQQAAMAQTAEGAASGGGTAVKQTAMERMRQQTHEAVRPR